MDYMWRFGINHLFLELIMRTLLAAVLFFFTVFPLLAEEPKPTFNVLIVTGGHGYDQPNFYKMFDEMPGIRYDKAEVPKDMNVLAPGLEKNTIWC